MIRRGSVLLSNGIKKVVVFTTRRNNVQSVFAHHSTAVVGRSFHTTTTFNSKFKQFDESQDDDDEIDHHLQAFLESVETQMELRNYKMVEELLDSVEDRITSVDITSVEVGSYLAFWKVVAMRYRAVMLYEQGEFNRSWAVCEDILTMERGLIQLQIEDELFSELNVALSVQGMILQQRNEYLQAIKYQTVLIEERMKKRLLVEEEPMWKARILYELAGEYTRRALSHFHLKQFEEALLDLNASIKLHPLHPVPYLMLVDVYSSMRNYAKAIENIGIAIKLSKESDPRAVPELLQHQKYLKSLIIKSRN